MALLMVPTMQTSCLQQNLCPNKPMNLSENSLKLEDVREGYCHPLLICPSSLQIAYMEFPRSGSTSFKRLIAEMENNRKALRHF